MSKIEIIEATEKHVSTIVYLVRSLLIELDPSAEEELDILSLEDITRRLIHQNKLWALLAYTGEEFIGVLTLHECASIYAGGIFGEISELYVVPQYRSKSIGDQLISSSFKKAKALGWKRLEVGIPPISNSPRTLKFYENMEFKCTGTRMKYVFS